MLNVRRVSRFFCSCSCVRSHRLDREYSERRGIGRGCAEKTSRTWVAGSERFVLILILIVIVIFILIVIAAGQKKCRQGRYLDFPGVEDR